MNQIQQNYNYNFKAYPEMTAPAAVPAQDVQIPDIYYTPQDSFEQQSFTEKIKKWDMLGLVTQWIEHPFLMLGTCAGLGWGVDKFSKACGGEYEKSLLGKSARLGDNIQQSKVVQSKPFQNVLGLGKSAKNKVAHVFRNSDVINAIKTTPSKPEWSMVLDEMHNQHERIANEFVRVIDTITGKGGGGSFLSFIPGMGGKTGLSLNDLGLTKDEWAAIKGIPEEEAAHRVILKRLRRSDSEISRIIGLGEGAAKEVEAEVLKEMGLTSEMWEKIKTDPNKHIAEIEKACEKGNGKIWMGAGRKKWLGNAQLFERTISLNQFHNRFHSMKVGEGGGAKTATGRFMSKFLQKLHRGFTFGGGKLGVMLFVSPLLVETMVDTKKADRDQKVGTAAHGLVEAVSWVFTFPLALKIMHSLTGAQYAGMGKDKVEKCRELINAFNNKVKTDGFENLDKYNKEKDILKAQLKDLRKVEGQNLFTKLCRKIGSFLTMDLERPRSYRSGSFLGNTARKIPGFFKNVFGVPARFGIWAAISMGVLGTAITKCTKTLFGNYYDRYKEEEQQETKKAQKEFTKNDLQERLYEAQRRKIEAAQQPVEPVAAPIADKTPAPSPIPEPTIKPIETTEPSSMEQQPQVLPETETVNQTVEETKPSIAPQTEAVKQPVEEPKVPVIPQTEAVKQPVEKPITPVVPQTVPELNQVIESPKTPITPTQPEQPTKVQPKIQQARAKRDNYTYIPSSENTIQLPAKDENSKNKYIPSQIGAKFAKTFDNSNLEGALKRADRAEQKALQTLAGNFGNM